MATEAPTSPESPAEFAAEGSPAVAEDARTPSEPPSATEPSGSLKKQGLGVAVVAGLLAFLLMAHKGQLPFGVPLGMVLVTACALGLLAALGTFDAAEGGEGALRPAPIGALGVFVAGGVAFAAALGLAGWGLGPGALWAVLVPATFLAWVVSFFRLGVALGVERGHDLQPQGLVDQLVQFRHAQAPRSQRPPTNSPPPPTAAIQKASQGWKAK